MPDVKLFAQKSNKQLFLC